MHFQLLGPFRVTVGDQPLKLGSPQQQKLLAILCALPNENVSADRLVDELWGESPPPSAHHLIQVYVSRLRKTLGTHSAEVHIDRHGTGYALHVDPEQVDAARMEALATRARDLDEEAVDAKTRLLLEATEMWVGPPFGDLKDESITLQSESTRLTELYVGLLEERIRIDLNAGRHQRVLDELKRLTSEYPYREAIWELWMLALYRSGRQAEALRAYQALQRTLGEDLGIVPSPSAAELENRILLQDPGLLWEPPPPSSNAPTALTSFVGRGSELAEISKLLDVHRLVTLTGPGGIGKTRLAAEVSHRTLLRFPDGVWWIDLAPITDETMIATEVARTLGVSAQPGKSVKESVVDSLVRREALLVFDNCEHVVTGVAGLASAVLATASRIRILATSRTPLHLSGEALWVVPALALPTSSSPAVAELPHSDAIRLFVERGAAVDARFSLGSKTGEHVVDICRRLDGMPLAIEMAAARLRVLTTAEIAEALNDRFALLKATQHDVSDRHETLQTMVDWSYQLLPQEIQPAFARLAVFAGAFDLEGATAIALGGGEPTPLEAMTALVEASLVTRVDDSDSAGRYRLLETLREYGRRLLAERGRLDAVRDAHATYFLELVASADDQIGKPGFVDWMKRFQESYDDIQQALDWSVDRDLPSLALRVTPVLQHYWYRTGDAREANRWGRRLTDHRELEPASQVAAAHTALSFSATILVDPPTAIEHADRAVALLAADDDRRGYATALFGRANVALMVGDFETLCRTSAQCLEVCDEIEYSWGKAGALAALSFAEFFGGGSLSRARALAEQAVPIFRNLGDIASQTVLNPISAIALQQGELAIAERHARETASIAQESSWEATALVNLAEVHLAKGEPDLAVATLQRAINRALDTGLENWFRMALRGLAQAATQRDRPRRAARLAGASRRNMPHWGLNPAIYAGIEEACLETLDQTTFADLSDEGFAMGLEQLVELAFDTNSPDPRSH
jgi:predicted ATPase/DNA-binding SARP family transcriptional activator